MNWMEVIVRTSHTATEAVADIFTELGSGGVVIEDPKLLNFYINSGLWDCTDLQEEKETEIVVVKAYLPMNEKLENILSTMKLALSELEKRVSNSIQGDFLYREVSEEDWSNSWKQYFHPTRIGERIIVKPTWENYEEQIGDLVVELDPGMAFGTGTHHTTCLCVEKLEELDLQDKTIFDVGTGSSILSLVAAKLGAKNIVAVDLDAVAVKVAKENVALNNLQNIISVREGDLLTAVDEKADIIVANIIAKVILILLPDVVQKMAPKGIFLASGIFVERVDEICEQAKKIGLKTIEIKQKDDWALIVMCKEEDNA